MEEILLYIMKHKMKKISLKSSNKSLRIRIHLLMFLHLKLKNKIKSNKKNHLYAANLISRSKKVHNSCKIMNPLNLKSLNRNPML